MAAEEPPSPAPRPAPGVLRVSRTLGIPLGELQWRFSPSGGPGGQHANRSHTKVELSFDIESSPSLGPRQRARLLERYGTSVVVIAADERSQLRNRQLALARLAAKLAEGLKLAPTRRPTRPTRASVQRRLDDKKSRSSIKRGRRPPRDLGES